ncbi:HU family DNA-binding protein [Halofilum ochraceum]|uniref:HU family DNA-binding protein n=1 Tax=Halofilum ochraceum TaxID=1611323 RepID=UPI00247FFCB7|nr:HU family DNA-binding protein [Halofilum ochraceum]
MQRDESMNKSEFVEAVAENADIPKSTAQKAVDAMVDVIGGTLKQGDQVSLVGFGTFLTRKREARQGRNPRTGETINIAASRVPSFKAGKALKDTVN